MKKKFAILLLVVYFQASLACVSGTDEHLLHFVTDDVPSGSYKYYSLMYDGLIKIQLTSQSGDADLYISQTTTKPTYEPEHFCLRSATCGEDIIFIPKSFKRPVGIGVYGHPSHDISKYSLSVYQLSVPPDEGEIESTYRSEDSLHKDYTPKKERPSFAVALLWSLIDILFQVFFL
ncbi:UPF0669 protein C6orf120 homolog [Diprion similis]|uniref:UPF0669 protein C6orf120 homolog n=1 Tax=Diprion similis TaxID=362088 RepID=UPI001EF7AD73|nr:UPF0669 protein C6orf120 homolog [Diprion similis]